MLNYPHIINLDFALVLNKQTAFKHNNQEHLLVRFSASSDLRGCFKNPHIQINKAEEGTSIYNTESLTYLHSFEQLFFV